MKKISPLAQIGKDAKIADNVEIGPFAIIEGGVEISSGVKMVVDIPYGKYLNEGTDKMVARKYVGQTDELTRMQRDKINEVIERVWK